MILARNEYLGLYFYFGITPPINKLAIICAYLCVLCWDLQQQGECVMVKHLVKGEQRSMDAALIKVAAVLF